MRSLNFIQLSNLIDEINSQVKENYVSSVTVVNSTDILFSFSFYRKGKLLISLNHNCPFINLVNMDLSISTQSGKLNETLRNNIKDSYIINVETIENDRIVVFALQFFDELHIKHIIKMVVELIPQHPNLLIIDEQNKILFAAHYSSLDSKRPIIRNGVYLKPETSKFIPHEHDIPSSFPSDINAYLIQMINKRTNEQFKDLRTLIEKQLKTAIKKQTILEEEIKNAQAKLIYRDHADYLSAIRNDSQEFDKYVRENNIAINPMLTTNENIDRLYKLYKKNKKTISSNQEQIEFNKKDITKLQNELALFETNDINCLIELSNKKLKTKLKPANVVNPNLPYYLNINGGKIYYGKNADQNNYVSFKIANKNDLFFHIKNYSGSHVILSKQTPTNDDLLLAAEIAVFLSGKEIGEVDYCFVSNITKGPKTGLVLMSSYKTIIIKIIHEETKQTLKGTKRCSF